MKEYKPTSGARWRRLSKQACNPTVQIKQRVFTLVAACAAGFLALVANAQVPLHQEQTFTGAAPPVTSFSSKSIAGTGGGIATAVDLDAAVQTNTAASINTPLATSTAAAPGQLGQAIWTSGGGNGGMLVTRPAGNAFTILMGTVTNYTGGASSSVVISYVFGMPSALAGEDVELAGHRVYYSTTGLANSWTLIPELTSATPTPVAGNPLHTLAVSIPANGLLYLIWVDDNGGPGTDGSFSIDNFVCGYGHGPAIARQPTNVTNFQNRTVSFSVGATGPGLAYQWNKVGSGPLSDGPTGTGATIAGANSTTLVISNAQPGDTGDYFVAVSNPFSGGPITSATVHLQINTDTEPPQFVRARGDADAFTFIVTFNEVVCSDPACGYDAGVYTFVWTVQNADNPAEDLSVTNAVIAPEGTNVILTVQIPRTPGALYRISVLNSGPGSGFYVTDLAGNAMPDASFVITSPTVTFQQGANGYAGTQDAGIHSGAGMDTPDPTNPTINVDTDDGGIRQALLRFDNIIGSGAGQIPLGAIINSAILTINQTDNGNPANFHRMRVPWDQTTATWNSLDGGLTADGVEAATAIDVVTPGLNGVVGAITMDVRASVQAWANGQPNYGWAILPTGGDGWRWSTSDTATGPRLTVAYAGGLIEHFPPVITVQPPASTTVLEGATVTISVGVAVAGSPTNQWKKGGVDVPGQTNLTLRIVNFSPCDAGSYTLRVSNESGFAETSPAVLVVNYDTTHPVLTRAVSASSTSIVLTFNKQMGATATAISNYTLSSGATVTAAALSNGLPNATVTLTTSARSTTTTLTIAGVTDNRRACSNLNGNLINPNPTVVAITGVSIPAGAEWNGSWSYNTNNLDGTPTWKDVGFVPGGDWLTGNALFGTEPDAGVVDLLPIIIITPIPPNTNTPPDFVTVYFRKSVTLPALAGGMSYLLEHMIDDGAVFYWDGVEFGRYNMTNGSVVYSTKAAATIEASPQSIALPASANAGGAHLLAVELHQGGATTSSDIIFGGQIAAVSGPAPSLRISHSGGTNTVNWTADSRWRLVRSAVVTGPYAAVAGNPFQSFRVPPAANTNSAFFKLQFNSNR